MVHFSCFLIQFHFSALHTTATLTLMIVLEFHGIAGCQRATFFIYPHQPACLGCPLPPSLPSKAELFVCLPTGPPEHNTRTVAWKKRQLRLLLTYSRTSSKCFVNFLFRHFHSMACWDHRWNQRFTCSTAKIQSSGIGRLLPVDTYDPYSGAWERSREKSFLATSNSGHSSVREKNSFFSTGLLVPKSSSSSVLFGFFILNRSIDRSESSNSTLRGNQLTVVFLFPATNHGSPQNFIPVFRYDTSKKRPRKFLYMINTICLGIA